MYDGQLDVDVVNLNNNTKIGQFSYLFNSTIEEDGFYSMGDIYSEKARK